MIFELIVTKVDVFLQRFSWRYYLIQVILSHVDEIAFVLQLVFETNQRTFFTIILNLMKT